LEAEKAKEKQKAGEKVVWELDREGFAVGGARVCAKYSQRMIPRHLPTVNRYV
jgi:hypothetical protein